MAELSPREKEIAQKIKDGWERPLEDFNALTFGELVDWDAFISLPLPGKNKKANGFLLTYTLFIKIPDPNSQTGCVAKKFGGTRIYNFPNRTPVIRIGIKK